MTNKSKVSIYTQSLQYNHHKKEGFLNIPIKYRGEVILKVSHYLQQEILNVLSNSEITEFLTYLDPDQVTDILRRLNNKKRESITSELNKDIKEKVDFLLKFNPRTAAGLMDLNYIQIEKEAKFSDVADSIFKHEKRTGKFPTILAVENGKLIGELKGHTLGLYSKHEKIDEYIKKAPVVKYNLNEKDLLALFKKHEHEKIVVLDENEGVIGVIHSDDILRLIQKETTNTIYNFAGVNKQEDILDPIKAKVQNRYKWLILNLGTAFLAASVVGLFQDTISKMVLLAVYMPIVSGMGGNAGTQTMAVVVRGLALQEINFNLGKKIILNEMGTGAINGTINGIITALIATMFNYNPLLGLVVGVSMIINLINAGFFGALIPLIMKKLGKDPATSATIFITTATDVIGFLTFLGLAKIVLRIG
ncbi:magnesium transporter MgtE [candidate division WWE3 bacterium CG10_big_fil_rev_8_21_14_0_10_32_10]|uniref:Magnesium transporter MgtE n=1 Tax=candidate division WWE3 bacterium CG10_big_fil_rev_8_21_14_0_10_32_10 TaxID=1975090 RepID=A0A2H0RAL0_UNCKA|nr:MAG: magnesium transporter MgtE [candidate division WWE3 bacterium CG10_big_fil_rev_8_21_14_0_10_32_10]